MQSVLVGQGTVVGVPGAAGSGVTAGSFESLADLVFIPWVRAISVFLLALAAGGVVLARYSGLASRSLEATTESPLVSVVYGVAAHLMIMFASGVFSTQLLNAGVDRVMLQLGATAVLGAIMVALGGLGLVVVGTWLTGLRGKRRPVNGLLVGASIVAIGFMLPLLAGVAVWVLIVSVGIGGATRRWIHDERTVATESEKREV